MHPCVQGRNELHGQRAEYIEIYIVVVRHAMVPPSQTSRVTLVVAISNGASSHDLTHTVTWTMLRAFFKITSSVVQFTILETSDLILWCQQDTTQC